MAIKKLLPCIRYDNDQLNFINHLKPFKSSMWQGKLPGKEWGSRTKRDDLIKYIRKCLKDNHGLQCSFCGLDLFTTSSDYIDHIAPKSIHPSFLFEPENLVLSCDLCNGLHRKREIDTISVLSSTYSSCEFNIVHPYFDDPDNHFEYEFIKGVPAIIKLKSSKAKFSNNIFHLDSVEMTEARIQKGLLENNPLSDEDKELYQAVISFNRGI